MASLWLVQMIMTFISGALSPQKTSVDIVRVETRQTMKEVTENTREMPAAAWVLVVLTAWTCHMGKNAKLVLRAEMGSCWNCCTVEPLLSCHPWGKGKWPIKRGWPLNRIRQKLTWVIKVISVQNYVKRNYGIAWGRQKTCVLIVFSVRKRLLFVKRLLLVDCYLSRGGCPLDKLWTLHSCWPLDRGTNNRWSLIVAAKRWPRLLNRGGR